MALARSMKEVAEEIQSSREDRSERLRELQDQVGSLRHEFLEEQRSRDEERREDFSAFWEQIGNSNADLRKEVRQFLGNVPEKVIEENLRRLEAFTSFLDQLEDQKADRREALGTFLDEIQDDLDDAREELESKRDQLEACFADLIEEIQGEEENRRDGFRSDWSDLLDDRDDRNEELDDLRSETRNLLNELRQERIEAARIWSDPGIKTQKEELTMKEKLHRLIKVRPDGVTLTEAAEELDTAVVALSSSANALVEEGKVRKEDKTYYPEGK